MKIVIDTNVIASAMFFGGRPRELTQLVFKGAVEAVVSPEIIREYQETAEDLASRYPKKHVLFSVPYIVAKSTLIDPHTDISVCRDPDDDKFIECAVDGDCMLITTGDKDLLDVGSYQGVKIVTVSEFFEKYWHE